MAVEEVDETFDPDVILKAKILNCIKGDNHPGCLEVDVSTILHNLSDTIRKDIGKHELTVSRDTNLTSQFIRDGTFTTLDGIYSEVKSRSHKGLAFPINSRCIQHNEDNILYDGNLMFEFDFKPQENVVCVDQDYDHELVRDILADSNFVHECATKAIASSDRGGFIDEFIVDIGDGVDVDEDFPEDWTPHNDGGDENAGLHQTPVESLLRPDRVLDELTKITKEVLERLRFFATTLASQPDVYAFDSYAYPRGANIYSQSVEDNMYSYTCPFFNVTLLTNVSMKGLKVIISPNGMDWRYLYDCDGVDDNEQEDDDHDDNKKEKEEAIGKAKTRESNKITRMTMIECMERYMFNLSLLMNNIQQLERIFEDLGGRSNMFNYDQLGTKNMMLPYSSKSAMRSKVDDDGDKVWSSVMCESPPYHTVVISKDGSTLHINNFVMYTSLGNVHMEKVNSWLKALQTAILCSKQGFTRKFMLDPYYTTHSQRWKMHMLKELSTDLCLRELYPTVNMDITIAALCFIVVSNDTKLVQLNKHNPDIFKTKQMEDSFEVLMADLLKEISAQHKLNNSNNKGGGGGGGNRHGKKVEKDMADSIFYEIDTAKLTHADIANTLETWTGMYFERENKEPMNFTWMDDIKPRTKVNGVKCGKFIPSIKELLNSDSVSLKNVEYYTLALVALNKSKNKKTAFVSKQQMIKQMHIIHRTTRRISDYFYDDFSIEEDSEDEEGERDTSSQTMVPDNNAATEDTKHKREANEILGTLKERLMKIAIRTHKPEANNLTLLIASLMIRLAERFCSYYQAVSNPVDYYNTLIESGGYKFLPGGKAASLEEFTEHCKELKTYFDVKVLPMVPGVNHQFLCQACVKQRFERIKRDSERYVSLVIEHNHQSLFSELLYTKKLRWENEDLCRMGISMDVDTNRDEAAKVNQQPPPGVKYSQLDDTIKSMPELDATFYRMNLLSTIVSENINSMSYNTEELEELSKKSMSVDTKMAVAHSKGGYSENLIKLYLKFFNTLPLDQDILTRRGNISKETMTNITGIYAKFNIPFNQYAEDCKRATCEKHDGFSVLTVPINNMTEQYCVGSSYIINDYESGCLRSVCNALGFVRPSKKRGGVATPEDKTPPNTTTTFRRRKLTDACLFFDSIPGGYATYLSGQTRCSRVTEAIKPKRGLKDHTTGMLKLFNMILALFLDADGNKNYGNLLTMFTNHKLSVGEKGVSHYAMTIPRVNSVINSCTTVKSELSKDHDSFFNTIGDLYTYHYPLLEDPEADTILSKCSGNYRNVSDENMVACEYMTSTLEQVRCLFATSLPTPQGSIDWQVILNPTAVVDCIDESGIYVSLVNFLSRITFYVFGESIQRSTRTTLETLRRLYSTESDGTSWADLDWIKALRQIYDRMLLSNTTDIINTVLGAKFYRQNTVGDIYSKPADASDTNQAKTRLLNIQRELKIQGKTVTELSKVLEDVELLLNHDAVHRYDDGEEKEEDEEDHHREARLNRLLVVENNSNLKFSTVLANVIMFRLIFEDISIDDVLRNVNDGDDCENGDFLYMNQLLSVIALLSDKTNFNMQPNRESVIEKHILSRSAFSIEGDIFLYYHFMAHALGYYLADEKKLSMFSNYRLFSCLANGVPVDHWNTFVSNHFDMILLGMKSRFKTTPMSYLKCLLDTAKSKKGERLLGKARRIILYHLSLFLTDKAVQESELLEFLGCNPNKDATIEIDEVTVRSRNPLISNSAPNSKRGNFTKDTRILVTDLEEFEGKLEKQSEENGDGGNGGSKDGANGGGSDWGRGGYNSNGSGVAKSRKASGSSSSKNKKGSASSTTTTKEDTDFDHILSGVDTHEYIRNLNTKLGSKDSGKTIECFKKSCAGTLRSIMDAMKINYSNGDCYIDRATLEGMEVWNNLVENEYNRFVKIFIPNKDDCCYMDLVKMESESTQELVVKDLLNLTGTNTLTLSVGNDFGCGGMKTQVNKLEKLNEEIYGGGGGGGTGGATGRSAAGRGGKKPYSRPYNQQNSMITGQFFKAHKRYMERSCINYTTVSNEGMGSKLTGGDNNRLLMDVYDSNSSTINLIDYNRRRSFLEYADPRIAAPKDKQQRLNETENSIQFHFKKIMKKLRYEPKLKAGTSDTLRGVQSSKRQSRKTNIRAKTVSLINNRRGRVPLPTPTSSASYSSSILENQTNKFVGINSENAVSFCSANYFPPYNSCDKTGITKRGMCITFKMYCFVDTNKLYAILVENVFKRFARLGLLDPKKSMASMFMLRRTSDTVKLSEDEKDASRISQQYFFDGMYEHGKTIQSAAILRDVLVGIGSGKRTNYSAMEKVQDTKWLCDYFNSFCESSMGEAEVLSRVYNMILRRGLAEHAFNYNGEIHRLFTILTNLKHRDGISLSDSVGDSNLRNIVPHYGINLINGLNYTVERGDIEFRESLDGDDSGDEEDEENEEDAEESDLEGDDLTKNFKRIIKESLNKTRSPIKFRYQDNQTIKMKPYEHNNFETNYNNLNTRLFIRLDDEEDIPTIYTSHSDHDNQVESEHTTLSNMLLIFLNEKMDAKKAKLARRDTELMDTMTDEGPDLPRLVNGGFRDILRVPSSVNLNTIFSHIYGYESERHYNANNRLSKSKYSTEERFFLEFGDKDHYLTFSNITRDTKAVVNDLVDKFTTKRYPLTEESFAEEEHPIYTKRITGPLEDRTNLNLNIGWCGALINSTVSIPDISGDGVLDTDVKVAHLLENSPCRNHNTLERIKAGKMLQILMGSSKNSAFNTPSPNTFNINGSFLLGGQEEGYTIQIDTFCNNSIRCESTLICNVLVPKILMAKCMRVYLEATYPIQVLCIIEFILSSGGLDENTLECRTPGKRPREEEEEEEDDEAENKKENGPGDYQFNKSAKIGPLAGDRVRKSTPPSKPKKRTPPNATLKDDKRFLSMLKCCIEEDELSNNKSYNTHLSDIYRRVSNPENLHELQFFRQQALFFGYMYVLTTTDTEALCHLLHNFYVIAFNATNKTITSIVGLLGNNGKSELMPVIKSAVFQDSMASISINYLKDAGDNSSHSGNIAPYLDKFQILYADEAGSGNTTKKQIPTALSKDHEEIAAQAKLLMAHNAFGQGGLSQRDTISILRQYLSVGKTTTTNNNVAEDYDVDVDRVKEIEQRVLDGMNASGDVFNKFMLCGNFYYWFESETRARKVDPLNAINFGYSNGNHRRYTTRKRGDEIGVDDDIDAETEDSVTCTTNNSFSRGDFWNVGASSSLMTLDMAETKRIGSILPNTRFISQQSGDREEMVQMMTHPRSRFNEKPIFMSFSQNQLLHNSIRLSSGSSFGGIHDEDDMLAASGDPYHLVQSVFSNAIVKDDNKSVLKDYYREYSGDLKSDEHGDRIKLLASDTFVVCCSSETYTLLCDANLDAYKTGLERARSDTDDGQSYKNVAILKNFEAMYTKGDTRNKLDATSLLFQSRNATNRAFILDMLEGGWYRSETNKFRSDIDRAHSGDQFRRLTAKILKDYNRSNNASYSLNMSYVSTQKKSPIFKYVKYKVGNNDGAVDGDSCHDEDEEERFGNIKKGKAKPKRNTNNLEDVQIKIGRDEDCTEVEQMEESEGFCNGFIKNITTSQTILPIRRLFSNPENVMAATSLIFVSNNLTYKFKVDEPLRRRMLTFLFTTEFMEFGKGGSSLKAMMETFNLLHAKSCMFVGNVGIPRLREIDDKIAKEEHIMNSGSGNRRRTLSTERKGSAEYNPERNMSRQLTNLGSKLKDIRKFKTLSSIPKSEIALSGNLVFNVYSLIFNNRYTDNDDSSTQRKAKDVVKSVLIEYGVKPVPVETSEDVDKSAFTDTKRASSKNRHNHILQYNPKEMNSDLALTMETLRPKNTFILNRTFSALGFVAAPFYAHKTCVGLGYQTSTMYLKFDNETHENWLLPFYTIDKDHISVEYPFMPLSEYLVRLLSDDWGTSDIKQLQYSCNQIQIIIEGYYKMVNSIDCDLEYISNAHKSAPETMMLRNILVTYNKILKSMGVHDLFVDQRNNSNLDDDDGVPKFEKMVYNYTWSREDRLKDYQIYLKENDYSEEAVNRVMNSVEHERLKHETGMSFPMLVMKYPKECRDTFTKFPLSSEDLNTKHINLIRTINL